jgi:hypothetical protein
MDPENQGLIKEMVDRHGGENLIVVLGAADPEAVEVAAETVTEGDPAFVGPLAGVQLGLPVMHIFDDAIREQVPADVYEAQVGFIELAVDADEVRATMRRARGED